ncbi:hypothetical protein GCM10009779_02150 [Polymorphospora rubra]
MVPYPRPRVSGRAMFDALVADERDPVVLAGLARGVPRNKTDDMRLALAGRFTLTIRAPGNRGHHDPNQPGQDAPPLDGPGREGCSSHEHPPSTQPSTRNKTTKAPDPSFRKSDAFRSCAPEGTRTPNLLIRSRPLSSSSPPNNTLPESV